MEHKFNSFEEIGLINPAFPKKSLEGAISMVKTWDFSKFVYPDEIMAQCKKEEGLIDPPKTIFVPAK